MKKVIVIATLIFASQLMAYPGGTGDQNTNCIDGHTRIGPGQIWFDSIPTRVIVGDTIDFRIWVNLDATVGRHMAGVMLLTGDGRLITDDGWQLISDPNGNNPPFNYNEKDSLHGNTLFVWRAVAPSSPGTKTVKARVLYGNNGRGNHSETNVVTITIASIEEDTRLTASDFTAAVSDLGDLLEIRYTAKPGAIMCVSIYDLSGRNLVTALDWLSEGHGKKKIPWGWLPTGYYIVIVRADNNSMAFKVFHKKP